MVDIEKYKWIAGDTFKDKLANLLETITNGLLLNDSEEEVGNALQSLLSAPAIKSLSAKYRSLLAKPVGQKGMQTKVLLNQEPKAPSMPANDQVDQSEKTAAEKTVITPEDSKKETPEVKEIKVEAKRKVVEHEEPKPEQNFENVLALAKKRIAAEQIQDLHGLMDEQTLNAKDAETLNKLYRG